jgi:hypothetical protein
MDDDVGDHDTANDLVAFDDYGAYDHDDLLPATYLNPSDTWPEHSLAIDPINVETALADAMERCGFDSSLDAQSPGWISNLQGVTAEYLVADQLNHSGDGLTYHLYSDPSHPDVDLAGIGPDGSVVRLLQVKATADTSYAETGEHSGVEVVCTVDGASGDMIPMNLTSADLRAQIIDFLK